MPASRQVEPVIQGFSTGLLQTVELLVRLVHSNSRAEKCGGYTTGCLQGVQSNKALFLRCLFQSPRRNSADSPVIFTQRYYSVCRSCTPAFNSRLQIRVYRLAVCRSDDGAGRE